MADIFKFPREPPVSSEPQSSYEASQPTPGSNERPAWLHAVPPLADEPLRSRAPHLPAGLSFHFLPGTDEKTIAVGKALAELGNRLLGIVRSQDIEAIANEIDLQLGNRGYETIDDELYARLNDEPLPSREDRTALRFRSMARAFERRRVLLADTLTSAQVDQMLGSKPGSAKAAAARPTRRLLAVPDDGEHLFPAWQFDPQTATGALDGLPSVLAELEGVPSFKQLAWFTSPQPDLDGKTPVEALIDGQAEAVAAVARDFQGSTAALPGREPQIKTRRTHEPRSPDEP